MDAVSLRARPHGTRVRHGDLGNFAGPVYGPTDLDPADLCGEGAPAPGEVVACIGDDRRTTRIVVALSARGVRVKVFAERPRTVLPEIRLGLPNTALALTVAAAALTTSSRQVPALQLARGARRVGSCLDGHAARLHRRQIRDPWLRRQVEPHRGDTQAPIRNDRYYPTLQRRPCELVFWPISAITATGIRTADGLEHHVDRIIVSG